MSKLTQKQMIERLLRGTNVRITAAEAAAKYGIKNFRARISEMKSDGLVIHRTAEGKQMRYGIAQRDAKGSRRRIYSKGKN